MPNRLTPGAITLAYMALSYLWADHLEHRLNFTSIALSANIVFIGLSSCFIFGVSYFLFRQQKHNHLSLSAQKSESERLWLQFFDLPFIGMAAISPTSKKWIKFNDQLCSILGYSRNELKQTDWIKVTHPDDLKTSIKAFEQVLSGQSQSYTLDKRYIRKDGSVIYVNLNVKGARKPDGSLEYFIVALQDISERKQAETELRIAATAFETQEGMIITDAQSVILRVNNAFTQITGYSSEEAIGQTPRLLRSNSHDAAFYAEMWNQLDQKGAWQGEIWNRRKNGEIYPEWLSITAVQQLNGWVSHYVATLTDITARKADEDKIKNLAFYDPLTRLPNRTLLADRLHQALLHCRRSNELIAVCMLDLDGFKEVNDTLGHKAGDQLLCEVARRLDECIRQEDTAARLGGDEFVLILSGFKKINDCKHVLSRIISTIATPYNVADQLAKVTASIGVALYPQDGHDADLLLRHADQSMYSAKKAGKNRYHFFDSSHNQRVLANQSTLDKFKKAIASEQLVLHYQPKVDCRKGEVIGVEALVRWNHPILGLLMPSEFIPLIEQDDLIVDLGEWVIQKTMHQIMAWHEEGVDLKVSINIAARQLHQKQFPSRLRELLQQYPSEMVHRLEIEIVETAALENMNAVADAINVCRNMGIDVALDDFGTGFSSLVHLKRLAADVLKIDHSFISGMLNNPEDLAIVEGVIGLATSFRRKLVAEGVDQIDQILMLLELGCDVMQGYGLAHPMTADRLPEWVKAFCPDPLWKLSTMPRPSRDYFELLLAEANHRYWIGQTIENCCEQSPPVERLSEDQHCRLGQWYHGDAMRRFRNINEFRTLGVLHKSIHLAAAQLCEHKRTGKNTQLDLEELLSKQNDMTLLLRRLRLMLGDITLGQRPD